LVACGMRSEEEIRDHLKEVKRYKEVLWKEDTC